MGTRPIDLHLNSFKKMGVTIKEEAGYICCETTKIENTEIELDFPSVGTTENIMLLSVLGDGITIIKNAAREPEIIDLQNILNKMGANINGSGTNVITIKGVKNLHDITYSIMPDRIEAGTFLCAGAVTKGNIVLNNVNIDHISSVISKLRETGCNIYTSNDMVELNCTKRLSSIETIKTMPYPGFPTDMQSQFASILSVAKGTSIIIENIFENRFKYVNELTRMGAKITIEGRTAVIKGVKRLRGTIVEANDLRGGAALIIAGLVATGKTKIIGIKHILRGYEKIDEKIKLLGGNILRSE